MQANLYQAHMRKLWAGIVQHGCMAEAAGLQKFQLPGWHAQLFNT